MIPELENLVLNSPCYDFTWAGVEEALADLPLELEKEMKFVYANGLAFNGWILSKLVLRKEQIATETVKVLVDDKEVTCVDEGDFEIDWAEVRRRAELFGRT